MGVYWSENTLETLGPQGSFDTAPLNRVEICILHIYLQACATHALEMLFENRPGDPSRGMYRNPFATFIFSAFHPVILKTPPFSPIPLCVFSPIHQFTLVLLALISYYRTFNFMP